MRNTQSLNLFLFLGISCISASCFAQVDQILQSIEQERGQSVPIHSDPAQNVARPAHKDESQRPSRKPKSEHPPNAPTIGIWGPKDRLPGNIRGQLLVGDFFVLGEYIDGGAVIYAVEDDGKGFIRQFVIKNASSGLSPATYYPDGQKPRVRYTRANPLVFIGKLFPGLYAVQTTQ